MDKVSVSSGIGFGDCGENYVHFFSLIENEERTRHALRGSSRNIRRAWEGTAVKDATHNQS
jgi:hypothetical protein